MGLVLNIILGIAAGWITGKLMKGSGYGIWMDLVLGLIGSFVGGWLTSFVLGVDLTTGFNLTTLVVAVLGAVVVVAIYRLITRRSLSAGDGERR
jgi:uncharacterized membrane protein YeaQ/YmgE (transglycosylase-associated protein family)